MRPHIIFKFLTLLLFLVARAVAAPATQPEESKSVEKDGVAVTVVMNKTTISTDEQPDFIVRFKNVLPIALDGTQQYRNLYDVAAYWDWQFELTNTDPHAESPGPWQLHMNVLKVRAPLEHRRIMPGDSTDVTVNFNDPAFTFTYTYAGVVKHLISPVRHLPPGHYQLTVTAELPNPFGPGYFEWTGPATTAVIGLTVNQAPQKTVSKEEQAAYDAAIARVTDKLEPEGLWLNGPCGPIDLPKDAKPEDVVDFAVNNDLSPGTKAYRLLDVKPFGRGHAAGEIAGTAALVQAGKSYRVLVFFSTGGRNWWNRFYDVEVRMPPTSQPADESRILKEK
jgi:hypothetical protein